MVGRNYTQSDKKASALEMRAMFGSSPIRPVYYVAEEKGQIVGLIGTTLSWMSYDIYQIFWVNVLPERQRSGIGSLLIEHAIDQIGKNKNASLVQLTGAPQKAPFYRRFGFRKVLTFGCKGDFLMSLKLR